MNTLLSLTSERLTLSQFSYDDAAFLVTLMNDPDWLTYIGDRGVHNEEQAKTYMNNGPMRMYRDLGFGILKVIDKETQEVLGTCGLLQRDHLPYPDLGFAFMPHARGCGYAFEASEALLQVVAENDLYPFIDALVSPSNRASIKLLERLGFRFYDSNPKFESDSETHCYRWQAKPTEKI